MDVQLKNYSKKSRFFVILLVLVIFLTASVYNFGVGANKQDAEYTVSCEVFFEEPIISSISLDNKMFTKISMNNCVSYAKTGNPCLPVYTANILIPYGYKLADIKATNSDYAPLNYDLFKRPIAPQQEAIPLSKKDQASFVINDSAYSLEKPIIKNIFSKGEFSYLRGYEILKVYLYPVKYVPKYGQLYYTKQISLQLDLQKTLEKPNENYRDLKKDEDLVLSIVENPEEILTYGTFSKSRVLGYENSSFCNSSDSYPYVIITNNLLRDATGFAYNWSDLINHRNSYSGLAGTIVTVEDIDACDDYWNDTALFNDTQAHIREFCKDAYQNWETEYILLGGDWDSNPSHQKVPYRLFTDDLCTLGYDNMACDLYYSNLDGDWYYDSKGGMWGGGKDSGVNDFSSELFVGRITAYSAENVSNAVYKIINYDTNTSYSTEWLRSSSFWGGSLGFEATSKDYLEEIRLGTDTYRNFTGFEEWNTNHLDKQINTDEKLYHQDLGPNYKDDFETSALNDEAAIINHLDHTDVSVPLSLSNWDDIYNTKPFFAYSQGCLSGRYQDGASGCEQLICDNFERNAFGLVQNTGYGYASGSTTDGASQHIMAYFWDYFFNNQSESSECWQLGKAMNYAKEKITEQISPRSHAWCYAWYSAHLFADPAQSLRLDTINNPVELSNQNPSNESENISVNLGILNITINDADGNQINWIIETSPDIGSNCGNNDVSGIKICNLSNLYYLTTYVWFVNATDGNIWTNESYFFTTEAQPNITEPSNFTANQNGRFQINLEWNKSENADYTYIEYDTFPDPWVRGEKSLLYNSTGSSTTHEDLNQNTSYYYQAWSWNSSLCIWSQTFASCNSTTLGNSPPDLADPTPENESVNQTLSFTWSIQINDSDSDFFNWSIECSNLQNNFSNNDTNGTKQLSLSNLSYNTTYFVWVNVTDSYDMIEKWYLFSTAEYIFVNNPATFSAVSPSNSSTRISTGLSSLSVVILDPDGHTFNWTIQTNPNIGSNSANNDSNGTKTCSISGLNFSTTYNWYLSCYDGYNWTNKTYNFKTKSASSGSTSTSGGQTTYTNENPSADAGGPYSGFVNQSISFDGSGSTDSDGEVVSYYWDFGDGQNEYGQKIDHVYLSPGNYSVSLTVTDDVDSTDEVQTYAEIILETSNESGDETPAETEVSSEENDTGSSMSSDMDNDGLNDYIEEGLGSDINNESDVFKLTTDDNYYFIDIDGDEIYDIFYNSETQYQTPITYTEDELYLIDFDGDGVYDYSYSISQNCLSSLSTNSEKQNPVEIFLDSNLIYFIAILVIIFALILVFLKIKKPSFTHFDDSNIYAGEEILAKQSQVHYFTNQKENKEKKKPDNLQKMQKRYDDVQKYYEKDYQTPEEIIDSLILSRQRNFINKDTLYETKETFEEKDYSSEMHDRIDKLIFDRTIDGKEIQETQDDINDIVDNILYRKNKKR